MTFSTDEIWATAKKVAKSSGLGNQWIDIIDYYNMIEGKHTQILCILEEGKYRILYILDDDTVLLLSRDGEFISRDYDVVDESQKIFYFQPEPTKQEAELPEGLSLSDQQHVHYYN